MESALSLSLRLMPGTRSEGGTAQWASCADPRRLHGDCLPARLWSAWTRVLGRRERPCSFAVPGEARPALAHQEPSYLSPGVLGPGARLHSLASTCSFLRLTVLPPGPEREQGRPGWKE